MDKYEEFKKWFIESDWVNCEVIIKKLPTNGGNAHLIYPNKKSIFENFEKEQSEIEKEKQVKGIIKEVFNTVPLNEFKDLMNMNYEVIE